MRAAEAATPAGPPELTGSSDCGDSITPGTTALIRTWRGASSSAVLRTKPSTPAFAAV